jgi:hypothetical protein
VPLEPSGASRTAENETYKIKQNKDLFAGSSLAETGFQQVE